MEILRRMMRTTCTKGSMSGKVGVRVMVRVGRVCVRAYRKLVGSIEKYFWVSMVEVVRIWVHANFIIIYVADELRMVAVLG